MPTARVRVAGLAQAWLSPPPLALAVRHRPGQAEVFFRKSSQPLRFCDAAISPMMVGELGVLVEEEEMRVEELIVSTKEPHEQLYRPDVDEQAQVSQPS